MALGFDIKIRGKIHYLSGAFAELSDFKSLITEPRPLRLNLSGITTVNSLGVRLFIKFMEEIGPSAIEFHECSAAIVDMLNTFPSTLGTPHRAERVKSILLPYRCQNCERDYALVLVASDFAGCQQRFPAKACLRCAQPLECQTEPDEALLFMACPE